MNEFIEFKIVNYYEFHTEKRLIVSFALFSENGFAEYKFKMRLNPN